MGRVIRPFCWHQNLVPWGLSAPAPGLHVLNHEKKKCIKSHFKEIFFKLATNEWSDKTISVDIKTSSPGGCLPLLMNIYCIKSDFKEIFWNLQHMTEVTRGSCWHQNFVPKGLSAPALGLYTCIKSWKNLYKLVANDLSEKRFLWNSQNWSMFPLAFVAGSLQGHWWGFISRNYVVWPIFCLMNVFIALKGTHFWFLFAFTAAGVVPCGGRKTSPRTSTIVQFIFYFWSFEISVNILRNQKWMIGLDSYSRQVLII